jgi:hypothetical protein
MKKFPDYPMVTDWLQWSSEFDERRAKPDMPQVTLTLLSEMRSEIRSLEEKLKKIVKYCEPHADSMWSASVIGIALDCDFRDSKQAATAVRRGE